MSRIFFVFFSRFSPSLQTHRVSISSSFFSQKPQHLSLVWSLASLLILVLLHPTFWWKLCILSADTEEPYQDGPAGQWTVVNFSFINVLSKLKVAAHMWILFLCSNYVTETSNSQCKAIISFWDQRIWRRSVISCDLHNWAFHSKVK